MTAPGVLSEDYPPLCSRSSILCRTDINSTCYRRCAPCTQMFSLIPGESGDYRFTRYFFIQSSIQLVACILCLILLWYSNRKDTDTRAHGHGSDFFKISNLLLPAHHGIVLLFSGLSFINFLVSIAFAITELKLAVTYTFLLYTPSALGVGQICGVCAYLIYPGAGRAAITRFWTAFGVATSYYIICYSVIMSAAGNSRNLLLLPITVDVIGMISSFIICVIPNSIVYRRTGFRRLTMLLGVVLTIQLTADVMHFSDCSSCSYCSFILQNIFFTGMVQPFIVLWSLFIDSLYWLGLANEMAEGADLASEKTVGIEQPLVGISLDHGAASELARSLGSRSMRQVVLIPHNRLELNVHMSKLQLLGTGGTAKVYKGVYTDKSKVPKACAVKVSFFVEFNAEVVREVIREAGLCGSITNSRIVEFYGISVMPPSIALVFELCEHGSLEKFLRRGNVHLNEKNKLLLCLDCAMAIEYLHSIKTSDGLNFCHGDLKSPNFLVTREGVVKLSDLATCSPASSIRLDLNDPSAAQGNDCNPFIPRKNSSKIPDDGVVLVAGQDADRRSDHFTKIRRATNSNKLVGDHPEVRSVMSMVSPNPIINEQNLRFAPQWTAPEMLRTPLGTSSLSSDIYSLGVVFWEIFHQAEPFADQPNLNSDPSTLIKKLESRQIALKFDPKLCEAAMVNLFESMTAFEPQKRPTASEVTAAVLKLIDHENPEIFRIDADPSSQRSSIRLSSTQLAGVRPMTSVDSS